jgi:hypothetical protein
MADTKIAANSNVDVWAMPVASLTNYLAPDATEINTLATRLTPAISWDGTTWPGNGESDDTDDRSLEDLGNSTSRGLPKFEGTLSLFRPQVGDTTSEAALAWTLLRTPRTNLYIITRVLQRTPLVATPVAAGQWLNVYKFTSDTVNDDTEGDDSYKFIVSLLPQGDLAVQTQAKNATAVSLLPLTLAITGTASKTCRATLGGHRATSVCTWASSNTTKATVSQNGVVTGVSAGTANITATHASATGATTPCVVTVT